MKAPLFWTLIFLCSFSCSAEKVEPILEATLLDDLANLHLELYPDSSFQLSSNNIMGTSMESRGRYSLKGAQIWFHDNLYKNHIPNQLLISDNKLIFRYKSDGSIDTSFSAFFRIKKNKLSIGKHNVK